MSHEEFVGLVKRLEGEAIRRPAAYRRRLAALGALAYAYIGLVLSAAIALSALVIWAIATTKGAAYLLKIVALLIGFIYAVLRSLWVRIEPPRGIALERAGFPELFDTVDGIRAALRAPRVDEILLTDDLNAGIVQHPRFGLLGWPRNSLIIGLPLLQVLSLEQVKAVLAHEFGHLAGSHGRTSAWIYRSRLGWSQLLARMQADKHIGTFVFRPFFRWYAPYFNAYSFVLARAQEYEADRCSAQIAGARAAADALIGVRCAGRCLDERWVRIWRRADESPRPDVRPYSELRASDLAVDAAEAQKWLDEALAIETDYGDTHPCLRDRLEALGQPPRAPDPIAHSAAEALLGDGLGRLADQLDRAWEQAVRETWSTRHTAVTEGRARLADLEKRAQIEALAGDDRFAFAALVEEHRGADEGLRLYRELLADEPHHLSAHLCVGRLLLARQEEAGLEHLESAIAVHHSAILPASRTALPFLRAAGRQADEQRWLDRALAHQQVLEAAERERDVIPFRGNYESHGLAAEALEALRSQLVGYPEIRRAWFVRRRLSSFDDERPQWVLGVERRQGFFESRRHKRAADLALQDRLAKIRVRGDVRILVLNHFGKKARRPFRGVRDSEIRNSSASAAASR